MVNAVAGSGKTTTVINMAKSLNVNEKLLLITYSAGLKDECRIKVRNCRLNSIISVHSFHSLYYTYYGRCINDVELEAHIKNKSPISRVDQFSVIVIDEAQDMKKLLYLAVKKFLINIQYTGRLVVMGDAYQSIFNFMGSDSRFLTCARDVFRRPFVSLRLSTSFRLTPAMCYFVNDVALQQQWMTSGKPKEKTYPRVSYYRGKFFSVYKRVGKIMASAIKNGKWKVEDIFVLAASVKHGGLIDIANILTKNGIKDYYHNSNDGGLEEKYLANKVALINFHNAKGLERPIVIVCGFDSSYFQYYNKDADPSVCPEIMYVALTRASYRLIVINSYDKNNIGNDVIPFIDMGKLFNSEFIEINNTDSEIKRVEPKNNENKPISVIKLINHIPHDDCNVLRALMEPLELLSTYQDGINFSMPLDVTRHHDGKKLVEYVGNINSVAITLKHCKTQEIDGVNVDRMNTVSEFLEGANTLIARIDKVDCYLKQIPPYDWLVERHLEIGCERLNSFLSSVGIGKIEVEQSVGGILTQQWISQWNNRIKDISVVGSIDIVHTTLSGTVDIVEVKCVQSLTFEHKLQLVVYSWLWSIDPQRCKKRIGNLYLYSIMTNECVTIKFDIEVIRSVINNLIAAKYNPPNVKSYAEFIRSINEI